MATTTNFAVEKPTVGGYRNTWGGTLNTGLDKLTELLALALPIGSVQMYTKGNGTAPTATTNGGTWLVCDGSALIQNNYPDLYGVIGITYGNGGNASTHFNLPDLRARVPIGYNASVIDNGSVNVRSARAISTTTGGTETHTLTDTQIPKHQHPITDNGHIHPIDATTTHYHVGDQTGGKTGMKSLVITDDGHSHTAEYVNDWSSGSGTYRLDIDSAGGVDGTWTSDPADTGITIADHDHSLTTDAKTTGITTTQTNPARITTTNDQPDGDASHNIMQPYLVVNYIILAKHPSF
jgi:microcystin-dependent protein